MARRTAEDKTSPSEWLYWYEHHLLWWRDWMKRHRRCEPEEADIILFSREGLWRTLKQHPDGLTKDERRKLRDLDRTLKANAKLMAKALPELPQIRRRRKPPRSHWWWYLDKLAERQEKEQVTTRVKGKGRNKTTKVRKALPKKCR